MTGLSQNDNNIFMALKNNYSCISEQDTLAVMKMINQNNEIKESGSKYSGTSFDLYTSDAFVSTTKKANPFEKAEKRKQSKIDALIDEDTFPVKMQKSMMEKFADWLGGLEIQDSEPTLTLEDVGFDEAQAVFGWGVQSEDSIFGSMPVNGAMEGSELYM